MLNLNNSTMKKQSFFAVPSVEVQDRLNILKVAGNFEFSILDWIECTDADTVKSKDGKLFIVEPDEEALQAIADREYSDLTNQLAILVQTTEETPRSLIYRFNGKGFERDSDFTEDELQDWLDENPDAHGVSENGYLIQIVGNQWQRREDESDSAICMEIISEFVKALGYPAGTIITEAIDEAVADELTFKAEAYKEDGYENIKLRAFRAPEFDQKAEPKGNTSTGSPKGGPRKTETKRPVVTGGPRKKREQAF